MEDLLTDNLIVELAKEIPELNANIRIEKLTKGFSDEKKYIIYHPDSSKSILRILKREDHQRKKTELKILQKLQSECIKCPNPVTVGLSVKLNICYTIVTYIEGDTAEETITVYTNEEQYLIGFEAGQELSKMHKLLAPVDVEPWHKRRLDKFIKYMDAYKKCGMKVKKEKQILSFIESNTALMNDRPNCFQHDDFHLGNIIIRNHQYAGVIDFNRFDWGDPIHDFYKLPWFTKGKSVSFSIGQIQGYFCNRIPDIFWSLYSLYLAMSIIPSIVWCLKRYPDNLQYFIDTIDNILDDHQNFTLVKPKWYIN